MIIPLPRTDLVTWVQSLDVWFIVALLLVVQLLVEMRHGRRATDAQLATARGEGYALADAEAAETEQLARAQEAEDERQTRMQAAIAVGRARPVFLTDLPKFVRERARAKGRAWSLMPIYRVDRQELEV